MYDRNKPDLFVHPYLAKHLANYNLDIYYNILSNHHLTINKDFRPKIVEDHSASYLDNVVLEPYFSSKLVNSSGSKPHYTSYYFDCPLPIYTIEERGPRYVIWTLNDPLLLCATHVDRVELCDVYQAAERAKNWAYEINSDKSIVVFDLDETLIDAHGKILRRADEMLYYARKKYDLVVLYSHGSNLHVDEHVSKLVAMMEQSKFSTHRDFGPIFDLVLSNNQCDPKCQKNLLYLYNYFLNVRFTRATLVDDSLYNWTPEYSDLICPHRLTTLEHAINMMF